MDEKILDDNINIKTMDFGILGYIQFYMKNKVIEEKKEEAEIDLVVKSKWLNSSQQTDIETEVTITDKKENPSIKGNLNISLSDYLAVYLRKTDLGTKVPFTVYADDQVLDWSYTGQSYIFSLDQITYLTWNFNFANDVVDSYFINSNGTLLNNFDFVFGTSEGNSIEGIKEFKIVFNEIEYTTKTTVLNTNVTMTDFATINDVNEISSSALIAKTYQPLYITHSSSPGPIEATGTGIPNYIDYSTEIYSYVGNYLNITNIPSTDKEFGINYFMNLENLMYTSAPLKNFIEVKINNSIIEFEVTTNTMSDYDFDPKLYLMLNSLNIDYSSGNYYLYRSKQINENGDYYWLVFSKETYDIALNSIGYNGYEYASKTICENTGCKTFKYTTPATWSVYLFNAVGKKVDLNYTYTLDNISNVNEATNVNNKVEVFNGEYTEEKNIVNTISSLDYITLKGEHLNNGWVRWNVEVDLNKLDVLYSSGSLKSASSYNLFYIGFSDNQTLGYRNGKPDVFNPETELIDDTSTKNDSNFYTNQLLVKNDEGYQTFNTGNIYTMSGTIGGDSRTQFITLQTQNNMKYYVVYMDSSNEYIVNGKLNLVYFTNRISYNNQELKSAFQMASFGSSRLGGPPGVIQTFNVQTEDILDNYFCHSKNNYTNRKKNATTDLSLWYFTTFSYPSTYKYNGYYYVHDKINSTKIFKDNLLITDDINAGTYSKISKFDIEFVYNSYVYHLIINSDNYSSNKEYSIYINNKVYKVKLDYDFENGNMEDGFIFEAFKLKDITDITINYEMETDLVAIYESANLSPLQKYTLKYDNIAYLTEIEDGTAPYYRTSNSTSIISSLATTKKIKTNYQTDKHYWDKKSYEATATIGYSDVSYLDFKDFIQEYYNYDNKETVYSSAEARQALANFIDIKNMKITALAIGETTETTIYENGAFTDEWINSTLTFSTNHENGDLYDIHFVKTDADIPAGTKFTITYDGILNLDKKDSNGKAFRELDYYLGDEIYITNNVKAVIPYVTASTLSEELPSLDSHFDNLISTLAVDDYENYVDTENQQLVCYGGAGAGGVYLQERIINKTMKSSISANTTNWEIKEIINSAGKDNTLDIDLVDTFYFKINNTLSGTTLSDEQKEVLKQNLQYLLEKHSSFKDLKVYYEVDETSNLLYQLDGIIDEEEEKDIVSIDGLHKGKLRYVKEVFNKVSDTEATLSDKKLYLSFDNFDYDTSVSIKYSIYTDWEAFVQEAHQAGLLNDSYNIVGTTETVKAVMQNDVVEASEYKAHSGGSSISITDQLSKINKSVLSRSNDVVSWQLTANTGTISSPITITDTMELTATDEKVINDLNKSMVFKDFVIKIDGKIAYDGTSDEPYKNGWTSDNVLLVVDDFTFTVTLKDTDTNKFIANDSDVVITYKTGIDMNKYNDLGGNMSGTYNIHNESLLEKNGIKSSATRDLNGISFEFPLSVLKSFVGNDENDLEMTNWNIVMNTGSLDRKNVSISDTSKLASDFGSYLSIKDMKIVINKTDDSKNVTSEVIYDFGEGITTLPEGVYLYKVNSEGALDGELVFVQDGIYDFVIVFDELLENTEVVVDYKLGINRVKYIENKEISDFELVNNNEVIVKAEDGSNERDSSTGSSSVVSKLTKEYQYIGLSAQDLPVYRWSVGVNLLADNSLEDLTNANVTITDILDPTLTYVENSVEIYKRVTTASGTKLSTKLSDGSYTTLIEDNKLQITILNPKDDYDLVLRFKTEVNTTVNNLTNYVTLAVNGVTTEVASESIGKLFSPTTSGTVSSNGIYTHKIHALKYLDNKLSVNTFKFKAEEVNENGELVDNGYVSIVENSSDGSIVFDQIKYKKEGTYYYKITEVSDNDKYTYDNTIYTLKVDVVLYKNNYIISSESLVGLEQGASIEFKNYTKVVEDEKIENPNTKDKIIIALLILILSFVVLFNLKNFSKLIKRYRNV